MQAVCSWDPAIDLSNPETDWPKYTTHRDMSLLRFRSDLKPTVYHLRALPSRMVVQRLMTISGAQEARMAAFRACLIKVERPKIEGWESPSFVPQAVSQSTDGDLSRVYELVSEEELEYFEPPTILEIGEVAYGRAMLPKEIEGGYVLPPGSQRLLIVMRDRLAAALQERAQDEGTDTPASPTSEASGPSDKTGAATVVGPLDQVAAQTVASRLVDTSS